MEGYLSQTSLLFELERNRSEVQEELESNELDPYRRQFYHGIVRGLKRAIEIVRGETEKEEK